MIPCHEEEWLIENIHVEMRGINKRFGRVDANINVCIDVRKGEILALLGENGSGKSTLVNMLAGIYTPDSGEIHIGGRHRVITSPKNAIEAGIGMVHQHFKLVDVFTAFENIVAGSHTGFFMKRRKLIRTLEEIARRYGLSIDPGKKVFDMSVGEKQTVEIMKMLYRGAEVLILDEPTAVLTPQETRVLFSILRNMKQQGRSIILITHKLNEVMEISDRVTVLRRGEAVGTVCTSDTTPQQLTEMMVGKAIDLNIARTLPKKSEKPVLEVNELTAIGIESKKKLDRMSFEVYGGEILGVAGIAGSGQKELCEIIAGLSRAESGRILFEGESIVGLSPIEILRRGVSMSFVPEDRLGMGLIAEMDIVSNVMLRTFQKNRGLFIDQAGGRKKTLDIIERYNISTPSPEHILKKLSGGNIQKVLLGREVEQNPKLLITAYPVRGLDIGASYNVYDILNAQKADGVAVLYIGEDLDVLLQLCDRLMVIHDGRVMDIVDPATVTKEDIGLMMLGHSRGKEAVQ